MGKVYIVGAGPGDVELLTLKAYKLIKSADAILYDRLINQEILSLAKPNCELV
ncbi:SAM-dependent methyltransferase, partial [Hydrogenobacter hydrogenophilus]